MDNLTKLISDILAMAITGIAAALELDAAEMNAEAVDSFLNDEDEQYDEPAEDLWDNPPAASESWPNLGRVAPAPKVASWPKTGGGGTAVLTRPTKVSVKTAATIKQPVVKTKANKPTPRRGRHNVLRETVDRDARRRACVTQAITTAVGMKALDFVFVSKRAHGTGLVILRKVSKTGHLSTYRVDKDGNIRLSAHLLTKGGLGSFNSIKFRTANSGDSIIVLGA